MGEAQAYSACSKGSMAEESVKGEGQLGWPEHGSASSELPANTKRDWRVSTAQV